MCSLQTVSCAVSRLCHVQCSDCVMCSTQTVSCAVFRLCHVQSSVCAMCSRLSALCAVLSLCYDVKLLVYVMHAVCSHEPRRLAPSMPRVARPETAQQGPQERAQCNTKHEIVCAGPPFTVCVHETNKVPYIYTYIYIHGSVSSVCFNFNLCTQTLQICPTTQNKVWSVNENYQKHTMEK